MSHSIKVSDQVYQSLLALQRPRETFSGIIQRLIVNNALLTTALPLVRGHKNYAQWQKDQDELARAHRPL